MRTTGSNKTALKYKKWIENAFYELLEQYTFNEITTKQIALQADVSRQTFYRHFTSKEDIFEEYSNRICSEITGRLFQLEDKSLYNIALTYFNFWQEKANLLNILRKSKCIHLLTEQYNLVMLDTLDVLRESMPQYSDEDFLLIKHFLLGGFYNAKFFWMDQGFSPSAEKLAALIDQLLNKEGKSQ